MASESTSGSGSTPRSSPAADPATPASDAGPVEPVPGGAPGLQREAGRMADGRRITYYWSAPAGGGAP